LSLADFCVFDIMKNDIKEWDSHLISSIFDPITAARILDTLLFTHLSQRIEDYQVVKEMVIIRLEVLIGCVFKSLLIPLTYVSMMIGIYFGKLKLLRKLKILSGGFVVLVFRL
jgi:hypothetical protein